jgi:putative ABC transport system permease protein
VIQVEPQQFHSATLRNGPREKRVALEARPADATLSRVIGQDGTAITAPPGGILLSTRLAEHLELDVGDTVEVAFMTGLRETHEMAVTGWWSSIWASAPMPISTFSTRSSAGPSRCRWSTC